MIQFSNSLANNVEAIDGGNMEKKKHEKGSVTVEATLCVTLFMIFALFLTTLFYTVYVQEAIAHSVIQTADSLSIEAYSINKLQTGIDTGIKAAITDLSVKLLSTSNSDTHFYTDKGWYSEEYLLDKYIEEPEMSTKNPNNRTVDLAEVIKERFVGYLYNGNEEDADAFLKKMGVIDGLDGLDFSNSTVKSGKLYISLDYKLKYLVNIGDLGKLQVNQAYCSEIW